MVAIPFPTSSAPGINPQEGGGRLVNGFAQKAPPSGKAQILWRRSAGLRRVLENADHVHFRGAIMATTSVMLVVYDGYVYRVTVTGDTFDKAAVGLIDGSEPVTIAINNASPTNIVCVTEGGAWNLFTGSTPTGFADGDLPGSPTSVSVLNGYFLFTYANGRIYASDLNTVSVSSSSFTTEQGLNIRRGVALRGQFFAMGDKWTAVYRDVGTSPFPLERETVIPRGILGKHAVAGWEPGWSNTLVWVGEDHVVYRLDGYNPVPISTPAIVRSIRSSADHSLIHASVYMAEDNAFWVMTSPGEWTWEFNLTTGEWNERHSADEHDWRGRGGINGFDRWLVGDVTTGNLYHVDTDYRYENGDGEIEWVLESGHMSAFPQRFSPAAAAFDFTAAVGQADGDSGILTDPKVMISWSLDGGYYWGNELTRELGAQGKSIARVMVHRLGHVREKGLKFRLSVSDPVALGFMGGELLTAL